MSISYTPSTIDVALDRDIESTVARCSDLPLDGLRVLVLTSGHEATDHRVYSKIAVGAKRLGADVTVVGSLVHSVPGNVPVVPVAGPKSRLGRFLLQPWRCLWAIRRERPHIFHFHDPELLATLPLAKLWWRQTAFVYDVHEDFANLMLIRDWLPGALKPVVKTLTNGVEKSLALLVDAIVGVTPPLTDKFLNRDKIVAYNFISKEFFEQAEKLAVEPRKRRYDLVHVGTLNLRRAGFLLEVLQRYHQDRPSARSLIIGASAEVQDAMLQGLPAGCTILGKVPYAEVPGLLAEAKVGLDVHPWSGPHLQVALPVKVCEYMAAGCAFVSSSMPVLDAVLEQAGIAATEARLIRGGQPVDYARAAGDLVDAIEHGADPGASLRARAASHLVWEKQADQVGRLYRRLKDRKCAG